MAIALGSLLAGAIYTWFVGEDVNWDWQNYHEYNVWAVINGRYGLDALPAGFQTYFNPAVYFPIYYLRHLLPLPYGLMIIGAVHGLNLLLIYFLIRVLLRETGRDADALVSFDKAVTIDINHPLAGETLHFEVEVLAIRKATSDEMKHGHAHGAHGHHHH